MLQGRPRFRWICGNLTTHVGVRGAKPLAMGAFSGNLEFLWEAEIRPFRG